MAVPNDALAPVLGLEIGMLAEKPGDLGFDRLGQQGTCPVAQIFGQLVVEGSWLNQLDMLSLDTAYRSFGGEVEASSTPTICRLPDSRRHQLPAIAETMPEMWREDPCRSPAVLGRPRCRMHGGA